VQHPASPEVGHAVPGCPTLSTQVCCSIGTDEGATWVNVHMLTLPEPNVHAKATVLGPESAPASALPRGLVFPTQELEQTEVSQSVTDAPALSHPAVMLDWHPDERLSA
jgi:hypothetical protein